MSWSFPVRAKAHPGMTSLSRIAAMLPYAPLNVSGTTLPGMPPPAAAGSRPELS